MKNNIFKYLACAAAGLSLVAASNATPITGSIGFTGTYTPVGETTAGNLSTATSMTIDTTAISIATGDFVGASLGSFASPIGVNGNPPTIGTLWTVIVAGPKTYTFTVTSQTQTFTSASQLNLAGNGTISDGTLADNTGGTWQLGFGVSGASFTWQSTSAANVPDGGTTAILMGAALSGLALLRRKLA